MTPGANTVGCAAACRSASENTTIVKPSRTVVHIPAILWNVRRRPPGVGRSVDGAVGERFAIRSPMKNQSTHTDQPALQRDPEEWKTGDEPMTDAQRSYLETLCRETVEAFDETL